MPATWSNPGQFNAALWETLMGGDAARAVVPIQRVVPEPPGDHALRMTQDPYAARLRRASQLLRERLRRQEGVYGPVSPQRRRLLEHQTRRLSGIVYRLVLASKRFDDQLERA